ncbi:MAG: hypothetical protein ISR55_08105 [Bacteroidetes bacterium]|nr:hypothetical protein [Bacteroidota bacterium]
MKTITIDIADSIYKTFLNFLKLLPKESIRIHEDDSDKLSVDEKQEVYRLKKQIEKKDFNEFDKWDDIEKKI